MSELHDRDLIGYGAHPPNPKWPGGARLALNFVINYEEGGEYAIPNGDKISDSYLAELISLAPPQEGRRMLPFESIYEFGSRVGVWRLLNLFKERGLRGTVFAVGKAVEQNPEAIKALAEARFEIASHHYRWIDYWDMPLEEEREHLSKAILAIEKVIGRRPSGIYGGRTSINSRQLFIDEGSFLYESDSYNDELPYWVNGEKKLFLIIPYALDNNDFRFASLPSWNTGEDFLKYNKATFDRLYEEGASFPKMMSVGLHCRLSGRPGRAAALGEFLDYVKGFTDVWICTREEIARHWYEHHPYTLCHRRTLD